MPTPIVTEELEPYEPRPSRVVPVLLAFGVLAVLAALAVVVG